MRGGDLHQTLQHVAGELLIRRGGRGGVADARTVVTAATARPRITSHPLIEFSLFSCSSLGSISEPKENPMRTATIIGCEVLLPAILAVLVKWKWL
jgi:hypothetical protein